MCIFFRAWTTHLQALNSVLESRGESLWMISSSKHFFLWNENCAVWKLQNKVL